MNSWNRQEIVTLLQECGKIALGFIDNLHPTYKSDHSIVTEADDAVEQFLTEKLTAGDDNVFVIGEESFDSKPKEYLEQALHSKTWIIDPIDGTALYAQKIPFWGTSVAFAKNGVIREGAIFIPGTGEMMVSDNGVVYYVQDADACNCEDLYDKMKPMKTPKVELDRKGIINLSQRMTKKSMLNCENPIQALCSCVYSSILLATGRHMAYIMGARLWDIAGALPCLKALGFYAHLPDGQNLLSLRLTPDVYALNFNSPKAFSTHAQAVVSVSEEISEAVEKYCGNLEV